MQVEHHKTDVPLVDTGEFQKMLDNKLIQQYTAFDKIEEFDQKKMETELEKPEVKEVHVFKRGGISEINARLRHDQPELSRRQRRNLAKKILRARKNDQ